MIAYCISLSMNIYMIFLDCKNGKLPTFFEELSKLGWQTAAWCIINRIEFVGINMCRLEAFFSCAQTSVEFHFWFYQKVFWYLTVTLMFIFWTWYGIRRRVMHPRALSWCRSWHVKIKSVHGKNGNFNLLILQHDKQNNYLTCFYHRYRHTSHDYAIKPNVKLYPVFTPTRN